MVVRIPLSQLPTQEFSIVLNKQNCRLKLYQRGEHLYMDITVDEKPVRKGLICLCNTNVIPSNTELFNGLLLFCDASGNDLYPNYKELEDRYRLYYIS